MFGAWNLVFFSCGHPALYRAQNGGYTSRSSVLRSSWPFTMSHCPLKKPLGTLSADSLRLQLL